MPNKNQILFLGKLLIVSTLVFNLSGINVEAAPPIEIVNHSSESQVISFLPTPAGLSQMPRLSASDVFTSSVTPQIAYRLFLPLMLKAYPLIANAYVTNSGSSSVSSISAQNQSVVNTIPMGSPVLGIAVSPDSKTAYVVHNNCSSGSVTVVKLANDSILDTIPVARCDRDVAFTPDGKYVYVTSDLAPGEVAVISTTIRSVVKTITVSDGPFGIGMAPNHQAYIANSSTSEVTVIDTLTHAVITTIPVGDMPVQIALSPDGSLAYVANHHSDTLSVINTTTNVVTQTIPVGCVPTPEYTYCGTFGIAITPDGTKAYVTNFYANLVRVIDLTNYSLITTIPVGSGPQDIAIAANGALVYVVNSLSDSVSLIVTATNQVAATIPVGDNPQFIDIKD